MRPRNGGTRVKNSTVMSSAVGQGNLVITGIKVEPGGSLIINGQRVDVPLSPRSVRVNRLPATQEKCIGRDAIVDEIRGGTKDVELTGPEGIGKTNLARHLAYTEKDSWDAVYYTNRGNDVGDILREILACFCEWEPPGIPTNDTVRAALSRCRPLVVLDSATLGRDEVEQIETELGDGARIIYSSIKPQLAAGADPVELRGLDPDSAVELAEQRVDRPLTDRELRALREFAVAIDGHPYRFLSALLASRGSQITLEVLTEKLERHGELNEQDKSVLKILGCLHGAAITIEDLHLLSQDLGFAAAPVVGRLERAGLVERHSPRVGLRQRVDPHEVDGAILRAVLEHFATQATRVRRRYRPKLALSRYLWSRATRRRSKRVRRVVEDRAEAVLGSLRTGAAVGAWQAVHRTAAAAGPVFGQCGLPGAWDAATSRALEASRRLNSPTDHAIALQERACYFAAVDGLSAAAPVFEKALAEAEKVGAPKLTKLISRNLGQVAGTPARSAHGPRPSKPTRKREPWAHRIALHSWTHHRPILRRAATISPTIEDKATFAARTWLYLRLAMVFVLAGLATAVLYEHSQSDCFQSSISAYYYTPARNVFVGAVITIGVCMLCLRGNTHLENIMLNAAGGFALLLALVPTPSPGSCNSFRHVMTHQGPNVANDGTALLAVSGAALVIAVLFVVTMRKSLTALLVSLGGVLLWCAALVVFNVDRTLVVQGAHYLGAGGTFVLVIAVMLENAWDFWEKGKSRSLRNRYSIIAGALIASAVVDLAAFLLGWAYWFIAIETAVLLLFAVFWVVQTIEIGGEGLRT